MDKCKKGSIVLLNGVSSSGKSSVAKKIQELDKEIEVFKIDDWFPDILRKKAQKLGWKQESEIDPWMYLHEYLANAMGKYCLNIEARERLFDKSCNDFYQKAKESALEGKNVVIDTVLEYESEYQEFDDYFHDFLVLKVLVYCPMEVVLKRTHERNFSGKREEACTFFQSFEQFPALFKVQIQEQGILDSVKTSVLLALLEEAIQELIANKIPFQYLPHIQQFKETFIERFKLFEENEINIVARHFYHLVLNTHTMKPLESAKKVKDVLSCYEKF